MIFALQDEPEKGHRVLVLVGGAWLALALWGGGLFAANSIEAEERPKQVAIRMKIIEKPKPEPPPKEEAPPTEAPPPPATEPPPPAPVTEPPKPKPEKPKPKPKEEKPPPPKPETPVTQPPKPVPLQLGMTIGSTDDRGKGPAVQVGNDFGAYERGKAAAPETAPPTRPDPEPEQKREPVREGASVVKKVSGEYTRAALRAGIEGKVVVVVTIGEDGTVKDAKLIQGLGYGLDEVAVEAAKKWLFKPATVDGKPIQSTKRITVDFVIED